MHPTARSWRDHFAPPPSDRLAAFLSLQPEDCRPLLRALGIPAEGGAALSSAENRVFGFRDAVVKFYRPGRWSLAALQDEVTFLDDLKAAGVSTVRPIGGIGTLRGLHYLVYEAVQPPFTAGREVLDRESVRQLSHLLAQVHIVGAQRAAPARPQLTPLQTCLGCYRLICDAGYLPDDLRGRYRDVIGRLAERLDALGDIPTQRVHGDAYGGNVLWRPDGPVLMDFDDFQVWPVDIDVGMLSSQWRLASLPAELERRERRSVQHRLVLDFYSEIRPAPERCAELYPLLSAIRDVKFDAWYSSRWSDPGFPEHYPDDDITSAAWWADSLDGLERRLTQRFA